MRLTYFLIGISLGGGFGYYLWSLYSQLTQAFYQQEQSVPTRIYSDVTRITHSQPRNYVDTRLRALSYSPVEESDRITFELRVAEYPKTVLPENHPQLNSKSETPQKVSLLFEGPGTHALLKTVELDGIEVPDVYLEPELVATLSRSGDTRKTIRTSLKFSEIPAPIWKAIIAIEDQHFLDHKGLDPRGIARAIWVNLKTFSLAQGGSTITQQLVKNLMERRTKNIFRKVNELFLSLLLEARFEKEQILERYLNEVYLGQVGGFEVHGVAEGAEHFFGKRLENLNLGEIALMAGLIRGPGYYSPYRYKSRAIERQHLVLRKMVETGQLAEEEARGARKLPIHLIAPQASTTKAPFFTDYVKARLIRELNGKMTETEILNSGLKVYTTLDMHLNTIAQRAVTEGVARLQKQHKLSDEWRLEGALAAVDHATGAVKALTGGKNYGQSSFNRILNMKRQVGSTFKPFVYLTAFAKGTDEKGVPYAPSHPAEDTPWTLKYDHSKQEWSPKNFEKGFLGWTSYRTALSKSINTIAARLGTEVGISSIIQTARQLGIQSTLPEVPSLALGVAELSPMDLLQAYAVLANRGIQEEIDVLRAISYADGTLYRTFSSHPAQVFDPAPIDLLTDVLQDVFHDGTAKDAKKMGFDRPAAGKTGTTNNHRDAWFAGFTPQLTTVVWVGLDSMSEQSPKVHLTGTGSALPIWVQFMKPALESQPAIPFERSDWITEMNVDTHTGFEATSSCPANQVKIEKFIRGHEPKQKTCESLWPPAWPALTEI
ncbi:MAG: PBP1A family penicillin-binding protein [Bdellovibrio sp.]|nr:PBP1A family penicillin-binding protein [Bdellovibrio sp.]